MNNSGNLSYLDKLTEIYNGHALQQSLVEESYKANANGSDGIALNGKQQTGDLVKNLLLRLVNETFLSLPIVECRNIRNSFERTKNHYAHDLHNRQVNHDQQHQYVYDACFVDWNQAKLVQEPISSVLENNENNELLLSSILTVPKSIDINSFTKQNYQVPLGTQLNIFESSTTNTTTFTRDSQLLDEYNIAKLTYLSLSSVLSICGLLINLLIILIIIVNAKQKTSSVVRSSSNTGHNNLLLAQLTITGFLIAGYVLVDNIYIFNQLNNPPLSEWPPKFRDKFTFCQLTANPPSPLTTFLPPTPFVTPQLPCSVSEDSKNCLPEDGLYLSDSTPITRELFSTNRSPDRGERRALVVTFTSPEYSNTVPRWPKSSYLMSNHKGTVNFIDLGDKLASVSLANAECRASVQKKQQKREVSTSYISSISFFKNHSRLSDQEQECKAFGWFATGFLSLLMNVIASVHFWTAAALAYDRYSAIAHPLQYLRPIHASRTRAFLILSWSLSMVLNLLFPITLTHFNSKVLWTSQDSYATRVEALPRSGLQTWTDFDQNMHLGELRAGYELKLDQQSQVSKCQFSALAPKSKYTSTLNRGLQAMLKLKAPWQDLGNWLKEMKQESSIFDKNLTTIQLQLREHDFLVEFVSLLVRWSSKEKLLIRKGFGNDHNDNQHSKTEDNLYVALILTYSLFSFVVIILVPLLLITLCNISIYRIVKVHERRISFSSANNITSASAGSLIPQRHPNHDNKSDGGSITSLIKAKLKFRRTTSHPELTSTTTSHQTYLSRQHHQSREKIVCRNDGNIMVNRSKRLVARQDSYKILERLSMSGKLSPEKKVDENLNYSATRQETSSCDSVHLKAEIEGTQKTIDLKLPCQRYTRRFQDNCNNRRHDLVETCSYGDLNLDLDQEMRRDSSFLKQLKMVGLSFVGIAVTPNETLNRSSSCSFSSLQSNNHHQWTRNQCYSSLSRTNASNSAQKQSEKKANITSETSGNRLDSTANHSSQRLFDCDSMTTPQMSEASASYQYQPTHIRLPVTIRTKSATFNVVFWLILTMLVLTLPHYLLVTIDQIIKLNSTNNLTDRISIAQDHRSSSDKYSMLGSDLYREDIAQEKTSKQSQQSIHESLLHFGSIWISCICRVLFLSMVPLNAWLYGIRSRTLRIKIGMILKRYVSRRQASIEINQRQRSISSARSRESSSINIQPFNSGNKLNRSHCYLNVDYNSRIFERCINFKEVERNPNQTDQIRCESSPISDTTQSESGWNGSQSATINSNAPSFCQSSGTIRFFLGDYGSDKSLETPTVISVPVCSSSDSFMSQPTGSSRSLAASFIHPPERSLKRASSRDNFSSPSFCKTSAHNQAIPKATNVSQQANSSLRDAHLIDFDKMRDSNPLPIPIVTEEYGKRLSTDSTTDSLSSSVSCQTQTTPISCRKHECLQQNHQPIGSIRGDRNLSHRRLSAFETTGNSMHSEKTEENTRQIRKSYSGLTFLITDANQESHVIDLSSTVERVPTQDREHNKGAEPKVPAMELQKTTLQYKKNDWWTRLKLNLSKLLLDATASILTANYEVASKRATVKNRCKICKTRNNGAGLSNMRDESKALLSRRNSLDERISRIKVQKRSRSSNRLTLRSSKTMINIDSNDFRQLTTICLCQKHDQLHNNIAKNSQCQSANQSLVHLKPPSFLKIMFAPDNQPIPYLGPYALSPIKECSSNHSYASSQSSLNNPSQTSNSITHSDVSNKPDPVAL